MSRLITTRHWSHWRQVILEKITSKFAVLFIFVGFRNICNFGSMKYFGFLRSFVCWILCLSFRSSHSSVLYLFVGLIILVIDYGHWTLVYFCLILISCFFFLNLLFKALKRKKWKNICFFLYLLWFDLFVYQQVCESLFEIGFALIEKYFSWIFISPCLGQILTLGY